MLDQEQKTGYVNGSADIIGKKLQVYGDFLRSTTDSFNQLAAQPSTPNITLPAGAPYNPLTVAFPQIGFRYAPAPRQFFNKAELNRFTIGLRGEINDKWSWDGAVTDNASKLNSKTKNVLYAPNVTRAVAGGYDQAGTATPGGAFSRVVTGFTETSTNFALQPALDPLARPAAIDPASLANVLGTSVSDFRSDLRQVDLTLRGEPFEIATGPIGFAIGGDFRKEKLAGTPDENSRNNGPTARRWLGATFSTPSHAIAISMRAMPRCACPSPARRGIVQACARWNLTAAYRYGDYSDAGKSKVPKYGDPRGEQPI